MAAAGGALGQLLLHSPWTCKVLGSCDWLWPSGATRARTTRNFFLQGRFIKKNCSRASGLPLQPPNQTSLTTIKTRCQGTVLYFCPPQKTPSTKAQKNVKTNKRKALYSSFPPSSPIHPSSRSQCQTDRLFIYTHSLPPSLSVPPSKQHNLILFTPRI